MRLSAPRALPLLSALSLLLLCAPRAAAQVPNLCAGQPCIQIGTYNIEWFGTSDTSKHAHRSQTTVKQIAAFIADTLDLEIVVLEEINPNSTEYQRLEAALQQRGYRLHHGSTGGDQSVVIAYDADEVTLLGDVRELDVRNNFDLPGGCHSGGLRKPLAGHFRAGQFDFVLVGVHLKSQLGGPCADDVRREQAQDLRGQIEPLLAAEQERDIIITGDFNANLNDPSLTPLLQPAAGLRALTAAGRRANSSGRISYLKAPFQEIIDQMFVRPDATAEWINRSTFIYNPPTNQTALNNYLTFFSDHAPVWASFRTSADDD
ncbi:MAG TPA: endonuclease/exonuclease/phosphatase family protein [Pyrinomonadaceae bacterium]|jgi:endonuclease/exonuclease/phosphatase family metal-dependent hydrolase